MACPNCGRANPDDARFCNECGAALVAAEPARESRKVVTVLFCDVVGSTALGEATDPEALRARMRRYFDDLRVIVERHGGRVEKFIGDAVMAVFGVPVAHEDDALRAVRAAAEMRAVVSKHGLEARIGVNTGEVVVGSEVESLVTGDAVNVAARLEQAAAPGEALIGARTLQLVRDAVRVDAGIPLALKGKSEPVEAFRLLEVLPDAEPLARHPEAPLVGRERERTRLRRDFEDIVAERSCRLFTLLGPAGIGKSRLVADFLEHVGDSADVLRGRCVHYGEGITYWPLVEILVRLGIDPDVVIGSSPEETRLAFRKLLETRAGEQPQIVVLDDLQWAEPVFLDLVEHVADLSRDSPVLLLCIARTELLDLRPEWGGGKLNATSILLEPLGGEDCDVLIGNLLGNSPLDDRTRERIARASEGNPLFVEEMLAIVREHGGEGEIVVPPTIHALLQARLDALDGDERVVIERGSVEGQVFHRGSVAMLAPEAVRPELESHLAKLVRKELIRPDRPAFPDDDAFRFRHLLIRDAAYESLPKATRAELHERFADWLAGHELVERDEILGYHLEQACRYRSELDREDPLLGDLSMRASRHLGVAGKGALGRGDFNAACSLLGRAADVLAVGGELRHAVAPDLAFALWQSGDGAKARSVLSEARAATDPAVRAMIALLEGTFDAMGESRIAAEGRAATREDARAVLEACGHDQGLALYWWSVSVEHWLHCQAAKTTAACEQGIRHSRRAGTEAITKDLQHWISAAYIFGPTPVAEAIERLEADLVEVQGDLLAEASVRGSLGVLLAMRGDVERGRELRRRSRETFREAGMATTAAAGASGESWIEYHAGDLEAAIRVARSGLEELERLGDRAFFATLASVLASHLYYQGRFDEAGEYCSRARESTPAADLVNFVYVDGLEALLLARDGQYEEAEERVHRALELAETTDFWAARGDSHLMLAEVRALAGKSDEAAALAAEGLAFYKAKGDVTGEAAERHRLANLIPLGF